LGQGKWGPTADWGYSEALHLDQEVDPDNQNDQRGDDCGEVAGFQKLALPRAP